MTEAVTICCKCVSVKPCECVPENYELGIKKDICIKRCLRCNEVKEVLRVLIDILSEDFRPELYGDLRWDNKIELLADAAKKVYRKKQKKRAKKK